VLLCGLTCAAALAAGPAGGASISALRQKLGAAKSEAGSLVGELQATQSELVAAEGEAAAASARERRLSGLLASGREKAARLSSEVDATRRRLTAERKRLRRARGALAARLVAMYESGEPSAASVVLGAGSLEELASRTEYLVRIQSSDSDLAARVAQVRRSVATALRRVATLKARADAYDERLTAARSEVAGVREEAAAASAHLSTLAASRSASLASLKSKMSAWTTEIQAAEAASRAEAEGEVERWLGGPYSIPAYIVMCESGGNYSAVNPSSGAGGAYQILPSTWKLYGGKGLPNEASKAEQDRIAAEIWADSGPSAWVCG
jgi:septal ring factor EnvC (AmiA/AmiB activator)